MGFATKWLAEKALFPALFTEKPDPFTGIIIVVPAYNEPGITLLLDSLASCDPPYCRCEVIIIVNLKQDAGSEAGVNNRKCIENINLWRKDHPECFFRLYTYDTGPAPVRGWGVGLARKTGMDEAVRRFDSVDNPEGVIVCLDADCTVDKDYFVSIAGSLLNEKKYSACSIYFEHPLTGENADKEIYEHIISYELHLRYYIRALGFSGFPYAFHTVGSAMAVKAYQYVKVGGMNRRQAGEDFYFIQKLVHSGSFFALNSTAVYPSPRVSLRVPFGTGATIFRMSNSEEKQYLTYNFNAFIDLAAILNTPEDLYRCSKTVPDKFYFNLPLSLRSFINKEEWTSRIEEINSNTSSSVSFRKRFYAWFNMFRIVKFLNFSHEAIFMRQPVVDAAGDLLRYTGNKQISMIPADLLKYFRMLDKCS